MTGKAIYPYNEGHSVSEDELNIVLPASYDLGSNLSNTNAAMYGESVNGIIRFNHLAGIMRFVLKNAPVGANRFEIRLDKKINGTFAVDLAADSPTLQTESTEVASEKMLTFNFEALTEVSDIKLYVPLPVGTYTTLDLRLYADQEELWTYSNEVTNTIGRKTLKLMPAVSMGGSVGGDIESGEDEDEANDYIDEYGINQGPGVEIDGVIWAPVNCGYHATDYKYGKLYQWGRKYGQGYDGSFYINGNEMGTYSDATAATIVSGPTSLSNAQSSDNSNVFFTASGITNWNWLSIDDEKLWNSGTAAYPVKTEYDPCPEGWRVPTLSELRGLLLQNKSPWTTNVADQEGYWFCGSMQYNESRPPQIFIPAAGGISYNGSHGSRGYGMSLWSSTPCMEGTEDTGYTYGFAISEGNISFDNMTRSNGRTVRCVRDLPQDVTPPETVDPSQDETANCYIISEAGTHSFRPTKGNSNESVGSIASVEVLWETYGTTTTPQVGSLIRNVRYENGEIWFDTPETFKAGNALIAARDSGGTILWSWHIWLTAEPLGQLYYNNTKEMMDRNLGATSCSRASIYSLGLLYQWGRKDPFLGPGSVASTTKAASTYVWPSPVTSTSSTGTIEYATANPTTFIKGNTYNSDWYYTGTRSSDNSRWSYNKSIYDPCPAGWKLPSMNVWMNAWGWSQDNAEGYYNDAVLSHWTGGDYGSILTPDNQLGDYYSIWYPFVGCIDGDTGEISSPDCWSGVWAYDSTNHWTAGFMCASFAHSGDASEAYGVHYSMIAEDGLSVRCQRE
ncbi:MAG: hypothetical protein IIX08_03645 [Bacteroidales bacterium]|nr:hypothetical protein [Bacteroidales bacterium]